MMMMMMIMQEYTFTNSTIIAVSFYHFTYLAAVV